MTRTATETSPHRAGRREWVGLAVLALPCVLVAMDLDVLYLAVPHLTKDLAPSSTQLLWITDIYGFLIAGFLVTMGTLGDRIGRRRLLLIGATSFGAASMLAAFSTSPEMLIGARALLGIAGATLAPSTLSLIRNMFLDRRERTVAISIWAASFSAGAAIGPLLGGVLLEFFWWGSVFLLAVPVMIVLLALGPSILPEFSDPNAGRIDLTSVVFSLVAVLAIIFGVKELAEDGVGWVSVLSVFAGTAVGIQFVRRQRELAHPLIDLKLFRVRAFSVSLATNMLGVFVVLGVFFFFAQYLQLVLQLSPLKAGLWTAPSAVGLIVGSILAPALVRRARPAIVIAGGMVLASIGFCMLALVEGADELTTIVVASVVFCFGLAPAITLSTDLIVGTAPPEKAGAASGMSETGTELGGALGVAVLGSIGTAVYRSNVAESIPDGVPPNLGTNAGDTLGSAVSAASQLPDGVGDALVGVARDAFTNGMQLTAALAAVVALAVALAVLVLLRHVRTDSGGESQLDPAGTNLLWEIPYAGRAESPNEQLAAET